MKKTIKVILLILSAIVVFAAAFVILLTVTEYRPDDVESVSVVTDGETAEQGVGTVRIVTWNIGYCGLGAGASFILDGGEGNGSPESEEILSEYYTGIKQTLSTLDADILLLQEVDSDSSRSYGFDEVSALQSDLGLTSSAYALNYSCPFVPFPLPPIGKVNSGILTLTDFEISEAQRISLPCPFSWPLRTANLKRCLLVCRIPISGSDRELVVVNLHLEAYDDGGGKEAQTKMLLKILEEEHEAGNYVIAGGDFNQTFPGSLDTWQIKNAGYWTPGVLDRSSLAEGWCFAYDDMLPTCRLLNQPYDPDDPLTQYYVIDGFILSPDVELISVETIDADFSYSDHNPVLIEIVLS
ncbi:MAG TPA: endonuclease [Bacillota bacterium]|nr:endonuclease [Bacillota bacterium]